MRFLFSVLLISILGFASEITMQNLPNGFISTAGDPEQIKISVITEKDAASLFQTFVNDSDIPFRYPFDGCYARASVMAQTAEKQKIIMGKIYVEGTLIAKTELPEYPVVVWGWHVAPVSYVKKENGEVELQVFDPGLFKSPVSVETWKNKMLGKFPDKPEVQAEIKKEYYGSRYQYFTRHKIPQVTNSKEFPSYREGFKSDWDTKDFDGQDWGVKAVFERYRPLQDYSAFLGKRAVPTGHENFNNFLLQKIDSYR